MDHSLSLKKSMIYDHLKVITIALVILGHCLVMYSPDGAINVVKGFLPFELATLLVYRFHVPCFFMVSGAIFALCLQKNVYQNFAVFFRKKVLRLMVPYVVFGILVVPPVLMLCGLLDPHRAYTFAWNFISGSNVRHLWYLYALFLIFMLMWGCRRFLTKENVKIVILVSFVVSLIFRSFSPYVLTYFQIANTFYYQFFFVCGVYLDLYFDEIFCFLQQKRKYLWLCFVVLLCSMFADFWTLSGYVYALCGMVLSLWGAMWLSERKELEKKRWYITVSRDSYGIYLIHAMIVYLVFWFFSEVAISALILMPLAFLGSLFLSIFLVELLRCIHLGFVIGESGKK